MVLNLKYASEVCWVEVCKKVKDAVVFVDDWSGESLHWHGGLLRLIHSGATNVKQYSSFENGGNVIKAVFIVSSPLVGPTRIILRDLISSSKFTHCILITTCSPKVLTVATTGNVPECNHEMTAVQKLEYDMLRWMKNNDAVAEIFHFPISVVPLTEYFFTTPSLRNIFPCFIEDLQGKTVYSHMPRNLDLEALPLELQIGVIHLMTTINSLLSHLSVQEEIYCIGLYSSLIGSQLQKHSSSALRAKMATNKMSLILIDRTMDLCSVMYSGKEVLLDRLKQVLPTFPGQSIDVAINMSPVTYAQNEPNDYSYVAPGCLHEPPSHIFHLLIQKPLKDVLQDLYQKLAKICCIKVTSKSINADDLEKLILNNFKQKYDLIQRCTETLQASLGIIETLKSQKNHFLNVVESSQKMILQSVAAEGNTNEVLNELKKLMLTRKQRGLSIEMILAIFTFFYSLIGVKFSIDSQLEGELQNAFEESLVEEKDNFGIPKTILENVNEKNIKQFSKHIFNKLQYLKNARAHLTKYKEIVRYDSPTQVLEYDGLINQLVCDIVDVTKPELPDLRYKANYGQRDNFTSRFSKILNISKAHVMDNEYIMVYIVGGITAGEVKFIKNCFRAYGKDVIVGSTSLVNETQILQSLFVNDPLKPFPM